ncbi:MAG: TetR family transcriptional regulator [[Clostridium] symbiosum]
MRKTKEDAELTKQNLLEAAFQLFLENGYDRTSLEQICQLAQVTRGAAYWHFKNKYEIFENTVIETLNRIHAAVVKNIAHNNGLKDEEILVELLWLPNRMTDDFRFVRKTIANVQGHGEFSEWREKMLEDKKRQYSYFLDPIRRIKARNNKLDDISEDELTFLMFYALDGVYIQDIPKEISIGINKQLIRKYVYLLLRE